MSVIKRSFEELRLTGQLPSPSGVGMQILKLTQGDDFSTEEIGRAISGDSALTGRLLKLANSAESGSMEPITTIGEATIRLGIRTVRDVALGLSLVASNRSGGCSAFDYDRYWSVSLARAVAGQQLSHVVNRGTPAEMYILGLLSSVGSLALASVHPENYASILQDSKHITPEDYTRAELQLFEIDHSEVAGCMLLDWGLPEEFAKAAGRYETTQLSEVRGQISELTHLLKAADLIAELLVTGDETSAKHWRKLFDEFTQLEAVSGFALEDFHRVCNAVGTEWCEWGRVLGIPTVSRVDFSMVEERVRIAEEREAAGGQAGEEESASVVSKTRPRLVPAAQDDSAMHILAVDDDPLSLKLLERRLVRAGHRVTTARDGDDALRLSLKECPQLVVADWNMPGLDGLQLCQALRKITSGQRIYFILVTGRDDEESVLKAFEIGVDDYVTKPFDPRILVARVNAGRRIISLQSQLEHEQQKTEKQMRNLQILTRKLRSAAQTDPLTGLPNRRYAMKRLAQAWESSNRTKNPVSVIMMDIDLFKRVNDNFGHDAGDAILKVTSEVLLENSREDEVVCRIGGEEFVVICANTSGEQAVTAAERLRKAVESTQINWQGQDHKVTISLGVASRKQGMGDFEALLKAADEAVYVAKNSGRNQVAFKDDESWKTRESA
jgi:two-component system cell cycle response regulator